MRKLGDLSRRFRGMLLRFTVAFAGAMLCKALQDFPSAGYNSDMTRYTYNEEEYKTVEFTEFDHGFIAYFFDEEEACDSIWVFPGFVLWSTFSRGLVALLALIYLFLGIAIISDIFMEAIQHITEKKVVQRRMNAHGEMEILEVKFWNDTIANLSLMALGSSAPEILLSCIETINNLGKEGGELGPATIVGSAAFNLFIISAVCVMSIPDGEYKRIKEFNVFLVTSAASVFAYVWLYIVVEVWTPKVVSIAEGIITFCYFALLLICSYAADKLTPKEDSDKLTPEMFKHLLQVEKKSVSGNNHSHDNDPEAATEQGRNIRAALQKAGVSNLFDLEPHELAEYIKDQDILNRVKYRKNIMRPQKNLYSKLRKHEHDHEGDVELEETVGHLKNECKTFGFKVLEYAVIESAGYVEITIVKKLTGQKASIGYRTRDGTATSHEDFVPVKGEILSFSDNENEKMIRIAIIDDSEWEPDEDFFIELYDPQSDEVLEGDDAVTTVIIIDDDKPGTIGFSKRLFSASESNKFASIEVLRQNGSDGKVTVEYRTEDFTKDLNDKSDFIKEDQSYGIAGDDYMAAEGTLVFESGEIKKTINIQIINKSLLNRDDIFRVRLDNPTGGADFSKKTECIVEIVNDKQYASFIRKVEAAIDDEEDEEETWAAQFRQAIVMEIPVNEDGRPESIGTGFYILHFLSMGWALLFALVPPRRYCGGWPAFAVALCFVGLITAVVADFATLLGCAFGLEDGVTAITFVALGTSLPDTFASKMAALEEESADAAIGNVTGSNSVNVFLGLGLPWMIASFYHNSTGDTDGEYRIPAKGLGFSVAIYSSFAIVCLSTLFFRRGKGGELGGSHNGKIATAIFFCTLWFFYILLSSLKIYGHI